MPDLALRLRGTSGAGFHGSRAGTLLGVAVAGVIGSVRYDFTGDASANRRV